MEWCIAIFFLIQTAVFSASMCSRLLMQTYNFVVSSDIAQPQWLLAQPQTLSAQHKHLLAVGSKTVCKFPSSFKGVLWLRSSLPSVAKIEINIVQVLKGAVLQGVALQVSLQAFGQLLLSGYLVAQKAEKLRMAWLLRTGMAYSLVLVFRLWIQAQLGPMTVQDTAVDRMVGVLAIGMSSLLGLVLLLLLPRPWLVLRCSPTDRLPGKLYENAHFVSNLLLVAWLNQFLHGYSQPCPKEFEQNLLRWHQQQLNWGRSALAEQRQWLDYWGRQQLLQLELKVEKLTDLLPVFELFGIGLPAFMWLFMPVSQLIALP